MNSGRAIAGWTLGLTCVAGFMESLDSLSVITAMPAIGRDYGSSLTELEWLINAYALALAAAIFTGGALGERFGRRRVFIGGVAVFTAASVLAALAPTLGVLVFARVLQGLGTAIVLPVSLTLILDAFPRERAGAALGAWSGVIGTAVGIGPLVGGALTEAISWHWIFWTNVPIGVITIVLARTKMRESTGKRQRLDLVGLLLISAGLFLIVNAVQGAAIAGWSSATTIVQLLGGAVLLVAFFGWEFRTRDPMLPVSLLRVRTFVTANASGFLMGASLFSAGVLVAQYLQVGLGYSPVQAGLGMLPWTAMAIILSPIAGQLADKIGNRPFMVAGLTLHGIGLGWFGITATPDASYWQLLVPLLVAGVGISLVFPTVANATLGAARPEQIGVASSMANAARMVGGAIGIAVVGAVFLAIGSLETPATVSEGMHPAMLTAAAISLVGAIIALGVKRPQLAVEPVPQS